LRVLGYSEEALGVPIIQINAAYPMVLVGNNVTVVTKRVKQVFVYTTVKKDVKILSTSARNS
jgi:hypothetical protein